MSTDVVCISPIQGTIAAEDEQGRLKAELSNLRRRGAKNTSVEEVNQGRYCARCKQPLGRIYNTGASCTKCRHRVCKQCREYRGCSNGTEWLCVVCYKVTEIQAVSGDWMNDASGTKRNGRRKFLASPADILKRSIRRSWTINGPPASWCAVRGSPELRAYQSLPRNQDYFEIARSDLVTPRLQSRTSANDCEELFARESETRNESSDAVSVFDEKEDKEDDGVRIVKSDKNESLNSSQTDCSSVQRISQIKPPKIHNKINFTEVKQCGNRSVERRSNIPIPRRSSREFEDIRSPSESVKRSLIPHRYRGSTDDLRRSREDITSHSQIPKLFSPRGPTTKDERGGIRRQDGGIKLPSFRKEEKKDARDNVSGFSLKGLRREDETRTDFRTGIKTFRRESRESSEAIGAKESPAQLAQRSVKISASKDQDKTDDDKVDDESDPKGTAEVCENYEDRPVTDVVREDAVIPNDHEEMVEKRESPLDHRDAIDKNERESEKLDELNESKCEIENDPVYQPKNDDDPPRASGGDDHEDNRLDGDEKSLPNEGGNNENERETGEIVGCNSPKRIAQEDHQSISRRKFSKEEFSNTDDTDDPPNRRSSSHLSPEASPLSTRSSRYSPRESESEPTPALPRKTGESSTASQRIRDAITRTRRESNSSTRYESSGSESIRLSGHVETRRVRFGGGSGIEEVQRDSATSAGEDEPRNSAHNSTGQRDSRANPGTVQGRALRRRRQFDTQGSRRRGRSHAKGCAEDFHQLQVLGRGGCGSEDHLSPPQGQQGQDQPIVDYRRLVFISSDSSSGREEDDADSSSGSSSLNGAPRSSLTQGLDDCDWDYFESGGCVPPLAHLQVGLVGTSQINPNALNSGQGSSGAQTPRSHPGIPLSSQDWSCCPGRGSSACQACGGARGANVFPVPVPIPVPVPYPVPVPASLWTTGLTNTSMINCTSAELGALQLSRGGGAPPLHPAAAQWFAWPPRFIHDVSVARQNDPQGVSDQRSGEAAATFAYQQARDYGQINLTASLVTEEVAEVPVPRIEATEVIDEEEVKVSESNKKPDAEGSENEEGASTEEHEESSASDSDEDLNAKQNPANSQKKNGSKMYRLSQGNSGSSSGRSSADSSDLEDTASHHFSRVFVVNDDSSTSDNEPEDVEDIEDSDSNREVGITLRRVTALPEDGPVVLRHVRFLDEDRGPAETGGLASVDANGVKKSKNRERKDETIGLKYFRNFDPDANEIYLVDSKDDDSERSIELKSVKSIDPDTIDRPLASRDFDKFQLNPGANETPDPDSLMPETLTYSCTMVPDSLEINGTPSALRDCEVGADEARVPATGDICASDSPERNNSDKPIEAGTEEDKWPGSLSEVNDDTVATDRSAMSYSGNGTLNFNESSCLNVTGDSERSTITASSETTTGSEVSSDELHEYEISPWSAHEGEENGGEKVADSARFGAFNDDLIDARNFLISEKKFASEVEARNFETASGFSSDDFSTDEGGSSRLDSGVATGVEDTNPSGRTEDGSAASFETTPGESIELVHSLGTGDNGDATREDNEHAADASIERAAVAEDDRGGSTVGEENTASRGKSEDRSVNELISIKIHEIFKSVNTSSRTGANDKSPSRVKRGVEVENGAIVGGGERTESKQVEGDGERVGIATAQVSSVERRPPVVKDGFYAGGRVSSEKSSPVKNSPQNVNGNRYKSLVMITQGAYQPVNVVTSDTTTLLQPDESPPPPPRGLAGYYHLALEAAADIPHRNGTSGPRRPPTVKRPPVTQPRLVSVEPEVDSGLSVGSASESDDVQSVKSASKVSAARGSEPIASKLADEIVSGSGAASYVGVEKSSPNGRAVEATAASSGDVVILEEGLADDDSWVEEVSHDEDEQGATTATEESSEDESNNLGDREEELRGYHRQAIDFTLHTIVEESCEESEAEPSSLATGSPRKQRPPSASELEKYFFFGLGEGTANIGGSREIDSLSETSSIYSEGLESLGQDEPGQSTEKNSPDYLNSSSRLEKYFLSDFLGFDRDRRDSDGSVGSDSEGRPSPEQRRKRLVRARGTGRSHSSSLDNLLALTQSSANLSSQNSLQDLSLNPDSQETQSEGSSTETDAADDQTPAFGTDGQFDTVKRKKKKPRNLGTQSPRIPDDRNKTPEPATIEADGDLLETGNSDDDRAKTPQPDTAFLNSSQSTETSRVKQNLQLSDSAHPPGRSKQQQSESGRANGGQGNEVNLTRGKQHSRDSGFIGSCDDLLQHQRLSVTGDGQSSNGGQDPAKKDFHHERRSGAEIKYKDGGTSAAAEQPPSQVNLAPPNASLSRKDSFNNWSSDEETNLMMSKMRQFFKTMVANSNTGHNSNNSSAASPAPSPRLPGSSPRSRHGAPNRTKPPQLVYFENELTRLMKTVPGIRDDQVKEIVEYLSSEDTWSDSYDSSDYTSSDLEGAGGRRSALQEQISQSCQQIISKFDTTGTATESAIPGKEPVPAAQPAQPLTCRDTALVYQKLVQSFTKMTGEGASSDASSTPHSSPPLIAKVMHHIGSRLVALMHEVSEGGPAVQPSTWRRYPHHRTPSSASTTEDDDSTSDSATPAQHQLPRSKSHDPLLLLNGHPTAGYQEGEEREASDNERFSWRGSFESALMPADSRTKLSLLACSGDVSASASALAMAAKRRSAGDLLFNPKSLSREQLDRVRSCGSIGGGTGSIEDKIWSNRRRSSVPDANTRGESGASAGDDDTEDELEYGGDSRATTLPRGLQSAATATNSLPRLPPVSTISGPVTMHKAHSVHHFLQQHNNVKSARYRPPGFARNNLSSGATGGPKRAVSAPGLQLPAGSAPAGKRENARNRRQAVSLTPDDGSSLLEACSTPIIGGVRGGSLSNDDEMDRSLHTSLLRNRASSSSLGARSDSMASVYSGAGEGRWCGSVAVTGEVEFALQYDYKQKTFEVRVTQCKDLAPVDVKRNRSDPYVKVYLLPDKSKGGKRKTKVKKHTLNPVFDETLKFHMSLNGLETRTLWLTVWHSDMFGRNDFLGEVRMPLENKIFDDITPRWYPLQERSEPFDDPITSKGEVIVWLKFVPPDPTQQQERLSDRTASGDKMLSKNRKTWSKGALHVLVKEARNLQTRAKNGGTCAPFCKSYLLPDKGRSGKQKTGVVRRCTGGSPVWGHTFIYKDVSLQELAERGIELTVWDHDRIASNEFLGGVRFNLGTGKHYGKSVEWMDATGREISLWQSMLERPNFWVEDVVALRPNLHNHSRNNAT